jgi:adenylylsulfate kinase
LTDDVYWHQGKISRKARAGEIRNFTGISDPYEPPVKPDMVFDTGRVTVEENLSKLIGQLESKRLIAPQA